MTKNEYILNEFKKKYKDEFGNIEMAYFRDWEDEIVKKRKFQEFLEKLNEK